MQVGVFRLIFEQAGVKLFALGTRYFAENGGLDAYQLICVP